MKDLAPLIPLILAALMLLNYLLQRIARWRKQQQLLRNEEPKVQHEDLQRQRGEPKRRYREPMPRVQRATERIKRVRPVPEASLQVHEPRVHASRSEAPTVPTNSARHRADVKALLTGRLNLRHAIVIMTVLGPCRAQRSPDDG